MMSQTPSIHSTFSSHSLSLVNLHVVDASHFITVGTDIQAPPPVNEEAPPPVANSSLSGPKTQLETTPPHPPTQSETYNMVVLPQAPPPSVAESMNFDLSQLSLSQSGDDSAAAAAVVSENPSNPSIQFSIKWWEYAKPPKMGRCVPDVGAAVSSSYHFHNPPGNMFLGLGLRDGVIKIYNIPTFTIASELHFPEMKGRDCLHIRLNLSREMPLVTPAYYRNPFRDLILTSVWSDGKVMVCQVAKQ